MSLWTRLKSVTRALLAGAARRRITCAEFEVFIIDYFEDRLAAAERAVFDGHLRSCPHCRNYLAAYRRTIVTGKRAFGSPTAPLPDDVPEDLVAAILDARRREAGGPP